jgi:hypothetical protein
MSFSKNSFSEKGDSIPKLEITSYLKPSKSDDG